MTRRSTLLFSSAIVTLALSGAPAFAQSGASMPPDTSYGAIPIAQTGTLVKSYADGRFERGAAVTPVQPEPAPMAAMPVQPIPANSAVPPMAQPVAAQPVAQPSERPEPPQMAPIVEEDVATAPDPGPAPTPTERQAANPIPDSPTAAATAAAAATPPPAATAENAPLPPAKPEAKIVASPVLDESFPEEREARLRIAEADTSGLVPAEDAEMARAARALAELPPVPEDIIANEPLSDVPIGEVAVTGLARIEPLTVESYLDVSVGEMLTAEKRNQSLKNLYASGLFADVSIAQQGNVLNVNVRENPQINQIAFEGNKRIKDEDLQKEIQLRPRSIYTRSKALEDTDRMLNLYRRSGRYAARVEPKVIQRDQNRVDMVFEINEGPTTEIQDIRFVGNENFSDGELRSAIASKPTKWWRFFSASDKYDPDRFNYDQELLRQFYLKHGYADIKVTSSLAEITPNQEDFYLTFTVDEGKRYRVGKVAIDSKLKKFDPKLLEEDITIATGDWYDADRLNKVVDAMVETLGNEQYAFASVRPDVKRNREALTVDITFRVNETPKVYVERINITGNVRTLDKVIRREMELAEGDPYNKEKLAKSEKQIKDLNFFKTNDVKVKEGSAPDQVIIDATVEEQSTGDIQLGAGYSTIDGPLAQFQIRERNLLGKGQDLRLGTTIAGRRSEFDIGFTEPYFLDRKLAAGIDLFHITRDLQRESSYDLKKTGAALRLGYNLSENWYQRWKISAENSAIKDVDSDASRFIRDQEGERATIALNHRITYDTRDSKIVPREGLYAWLETELAGIADAQYLSNRLGGFYYHPIGESWTFSQLAEIGHIAGYGGADVEINERFFIGGTTMHGFNYGGLGPRDVSTDDALGGNNFYRGSSELTFPITIDKDVPLKGHTFVDYGSVWGIDEPADPNLVDSDSLRVSVGVGFSWDSPFGPLRIDFSKPVVKEEYDDEEVIRFSFGTSF